MSDTKKPARSGGKPSYRGNKRFAGKPAPRRPGLPPEGPILLYGLHTVAAAFANKDRKRLKLFATENAQNRLVERGVKIDVPVETMMPRALDRMVTKDAVHQGMILEADALPAYGPEHLKGARLILALDQVTDPHNVGAILRSAVALDADAVVTTERHAPEEGPVLAKSASGALDMIKHVRVKNMARFVTEMKDQVSVASRSTATGPPAWKRRTLPTRPCSCSVQKEKVFARAFAKPVVCWPGSTCRARSVR